MYILSTRKDISSESSVIGPFTNLIAACNYVAENRMVGRKRTIQFLQEEELRADEKARAHLPRMEVKNH